jgi:hypothetical protein
MISLQIQNYVISLVVCCSFYLVTSSLESAGEDSMLLRSEHTSLLRGFNLQTLQASRTELPCLHAAILRPAFIEFTASCNKNKAN